jgi:hypothetical protein
LIHPDCSPSLSAGAAPGRMSRFAHVWAEEGWQNLHSRTPASAWQRPGRMSWNIEQKCIGVAKDSSGVDRSEPFECLVGLRATLNRVARGNDLVDPTQFALLHDYAKRTSLLF